MPAYSLSRAISGLIYASLGRLHLLHRDRSNWSGAYILGGNHISHFDPPLISVAARRKIDWMAMSELFENRWAAAYFRAIDTFPADRSRVDRAAVHVALRRLRGGHVVGMFPEGGIRAGATSILEGAPLKPGIATLAQLGGVPILPCVILGSDRLYHPGNLVPLRRNDVWIGFGEPIHLRPGLGKVEAREALGADFTEAMQSLYAEMRQHFSLSANDLPQTPQRRKGRECTR